MKYKIAIASAFLATSCLTTAEVVLNDFLSVEGFVDTSYTYIDTEIDSQTESDGDFAVDQIEISLLFDFYPVTAQIDLEHSLGDPSDDIEDAIEQAFLVYEFDDGASITAGRYASMIGFEAFEPTGLYQYSFAYDLHNAFDGDLSNATIIPGYANGLKLTHLTDTTFFGVSLQDEVFDSDNLSLGGSSQSNFGLEIAGSIAMEHGLSFFLGLAFENGNDGLGDSYLINSYATFAFGAWTFAAEVSYGESESARFLLGDAFNNAAKEEALQALLMANFSYRAEASVTARLSYVEHEHEAGPELDGLKYTAAHNYAFTDNFILVNELSLIQGEFIGDDYESFLFATELIFSF